MKIEITLTYNQRLVLEKEANELGVSLSTYIEFLLDEHSDESYNRMKRLNISQLNRKHSGYK